MVKPFQFHDNNFILFYKWIATDIDKIAVCSAGNNLIVCILEVLGIT